MTEVTSRDAREEESLKSLKETIQWILRAISSSHLNEDKTGKNILATARPVLVDHARRCIKITKHMEDSDNKIALAEGFGVLIAATFGIGVLLGSRKTSSYARSQIDDFLKNNTENARRAALKQKTPAMNEKKKITVEIAETYIANNPNTKLTSNLLMTQIRSDIEKKSKSSGIRAPSPTSISNYLREAKLP